jgi:hypothetical protein
MDVPLLIFKVGITQNFQGWIQVLGNHFLYINDGFFNVVFVCFGVISAEDVLA